jgi:large subunit ribosomal protein L25
MSFTLTSYERELGTKSTRHKLRKEGWIPGVLYGPDLKSSQHLKVKLADLKKAIFCHESVQNITFGSKGPYLFTFEEVQTDPVNGEILHFTAHQLSKNQATEMEVPLKFDGLPPGVKEGGTLIHLTDYIWVKGLPKDIPEEIHVDVSHMQIHDTMKFKEIPLPHGITLTDDAEKPCAVVNPPQKEEEAPAVEVAETESTEAETTEETSKDDQDAA